MLVQYILQIPSGDSASVPLTGSYDLPDIQVSDVFTLEALRKSFPFEGQFHFRVRVVPPGAKAGDFAWFDLCRDLDRVPSIRAGDSECIATIKAIPLFGLEGQLFPAEGEGESTFDLTEEQYDQWKHKKSNVIAAHTGTRSAPPFSLEQYPVASSQQSRSGIASISANASGFASALWAGISNAVGSSGPSSVSAASHPESQNGHAHEKVASTQRSKPDRNSYRYDDPGDDAAGEFWSSHSEPSSSQARGQRYNEDEDNDIIYDYKQRGKGESREEQLAAAAAAAKESTVAALSAAGSLLKGFAKKAVNAANKAATIASEKIG